MPKMHTTTLSSSSTIERERAWSVFTFEEGARNKLVLLWVVFIFCAQPVLIGATSLPNQLNLLLI